VADLVRIYLRLVAARLRAQLQYRVSFALQLAGSFALAFTDFLTVLVIFQHLPYLAGWSLGEVAFLYGSSYMAFQLTDMAVGHLDLLPQLIQRGDFDLLLTRPLGALFQVLTLEFTLRRLGAFAQGLLVLLLALSLVQIHWTVARLLMLPIMLAGGIGIFSAVWLIGATTAFWTVRTMEVVNAFTYGGQLATSYPMHIYGGWLRRLFIFVVPLAFVNYFPALYVLNKPDPLGAPSFVRYLSPLVAVAMLLLARLL